MGRRDFRFAPDERAQALLLLALGLDEELAQPFVRVDEPKCTPSGTITAARPARYPLTARLFATRTKSATESVSPRTDGSIFAPRSAASSANVASALRSVLRR